MHGYTNSGHPPCCAVALRNIEIIDREGLLENTAKMGDLLLAALKDAFEDHPNAGDIRGGKGLLAAVEFVEDRKTRKNFSAQKDFGTQLRVEMINRGVITRTRPVIGEHPLPGDEVLFAPPLIINEEQIHQMVEVTKESVETVLRR